MGKLTTYIIIMSGLMLLFYFTGLLGDTPNSALLDYLLSTEELGTSSFNTQLLLVLEGIVAVGIIVAAVFSLNVELVLMGTLAIWLMNLFWDFLKVFMAVYSVNPVIAMLLFSPVMILYGVTIVEWWRGRD